MKTVQSCHSSTLSQSLLPTNRSLFPVAVARSQLGDLLSHSGEGNGAEELLLEADRVLTQHSPQGPDRSRNLQRLAEHFERRQDSERAREYREQLAKLRDGNQREDGRRDP